MRKEMKVSIENDNVEFIKSITNPQQNFSDTLNYCICLARCVNLNYLYLLEEKAKKYDEMIINYKNLQKESLQLNHLIELGVDNWENYSYYDEEEEEEEIK